MTSLALLLRPLLFLAAFSSSALSSAALEARPEGPPRPPPEALAACEGKQAGDACSFAGREGGDIGGTCFTPAADKPLACRPSQPPPRPPRE